MSEQSTDTALKHVRTLARIARTINETLDLDTILQAILRTVVEDLGVRAGLIRLLSPDAQELVLAAAVGLSSAYLQKGSVRLDESQVDREVLEGRSVVIPDVTVDSRFQYPEEAAREGLCSMAAVPLEVRGRGIGVLRVYSSEQRPFGEEEIAMLEAVAGMGAIAIENARQHQSLFRIAEALNSTLDLNTMLANVLEATVTEMGLKAAMVRLLDPESKTLTLMAAYGLSEAYLSKGEVELERSLIDQRVLEGEPVVLYDVEQEPGFQYPEEAAREGIRSVLAVPLRVKDQVVGVMRVYSAQPRRFGPVAVEFLTSVADLVALAIENVRLHQALQERYEDLKLDVAEWYRFLALG